MRRGQASVEVLVGLFIAVLALVAAWDAYLSVSRQDGSARHLADRLETFALVHALLERDLAAHGFHADPRIAPGGQSIEIPAPEPIRWGFDADRGCVTRNGRTIGCAVVSDTTYQLLRERTTGTLTLVLKYRSGPAVEGASARVVTTWIARDPSAGSTPSSIL